MASMIELNQHINAVMASMDWPEDAFVPIANEENRKLMEHLQNLSNDKIDKAKHLKQLAERLNLLRDHYHDAQADITQNMKLLNTLRQQCESEYHLLKLAENDDSTTAKLKLDIKKDLLAIAEQNARFDGAADILNKKIDGLGDDMQWMKQALIEWTQAIQKDEQTNALIEKYCKDDQKKAHALEIRRQAKKKLITQYRSRLNDLDTEKKSIENVLIRTSNVFYQTHVERRQMIETWRFAVKSLNMRDRAVHEAIDKISIAQEQIKGKRLELMEQTEFLDQQIQNNCESEFAISQLNTQISQMRRHMDSCTNAIQLAANELIGMKRQVQGDTNRLQHLRQENRRKMVNIDSMMKSNEKLKKTVAELTEKVNKVKNDKDSSEYRLKHLHDLLDNEEKQLYEIDSEMTRLSQMLFRSTQVLQEQQNEYKMIQSEIFMLESANKAITHNFSQQEKELARQTEIQYDTYFKTLRLECRIAKMQGKIDEIDPALIEKRDCLQQILMATQNKRDHSKKQLNNAETMERRLQTSLAKNTIEYAELMEKLRTSQLYCENGTKSIQTNRENVHERLVEHSLLQMRVHQASELIDKQMMTFYDMEKHKLHLQLAIDERTIDLKCQTNILTMKRKHLFAEKDLLKADVNERNGKISALRARFELTKELLGKNDDGTTISAIQLKLETAQEKAILLDQGTKLNEKVLNAEKDIKALENTLILLNFSNDKYKRKVGRQQDNVECIERLKNLEVEYGKAMVRLKSAKANFEIQSRKCLELQQQREESERELDDIVRNRFENNDVLIKVHKEIMEQNSKVERAKRESRMARKTMTKQIDDRDFVRILEKDLSSKEMEHRNSVALHQLADLVETVSIMSLTASKLLYEKGLELPFHSQQVSGTVSRTRSRASVRSSGRNSECSFTLNSQNDGIISRLSEGTFSSSSSNKSSTKSSVKSEKSETIPTSERTVSFQIEGQSIGNERTQK